MNQLFLAIAVMVFIVTATVVPVMLAARWVNADNTGFRSALLAVVLDYGVAIAVSAIVLSVAPSVPLTWLASVGEGAIWVATWIGSGIVYSVVLGTMFLRAVVIGFLSWIINALVSLLLSLPFFAFLVGKANTEG